MPFDEVAEFIATDEAGIIEDMPGLSYRATNDLFPTPIVDPMQPSEDAFKKLCTHLQKLADFASNICCDNLSEFLGQDRSTTLSFIDESKTYDDIESHRADNMKQILEYEEIEKKTVSLSCGLQHELFWKDPRLVIQNEVGDTNSREIYLNATPGNVHTHPINAENGLKAVTGADKLIK